MDHNGCDHTNCTSANRSVCQSLSEMDWERGIWNAGFSGDLERLNYLIHKARNTKDLINSTDNSGYTALHYAARNGRLEACQILLQNGADIDAQTRSGKTTPLQKSAAAGKVNTLKYLVQSGACITLQDIDGQTALHKAAANKHIEVMAILIEACPDIEAIKDNKGRVAEDLKRA